MKYSKMFGKTLRGKVAETKFKSHEYLTRAGFVAESTAGRYYFLPLGWRVHEKIKKVIKEEMDKAGAQEMVTPVLHPLELWRETNRTNTAGFELMRVEDRRGAEFALGGTAEEMFVELVRRYQISYRDLPFNVYQFSSKFRDEMRARGGLLRVREFVMKDAYSFHSDEADFKREYEKMAATYSKIFERLGLETMRVAADNGYIGGEYSHEFQVEHGEGEGRFFVSGDGKYVAHEDVASFEYELKNKDEKVKDFEIVEQPEWVRDMEEFEKHYGEPKWRYLKNVVYRAASGDLVIAVTRGDLEVNKTKLERLLGLTGQLEEASEEDLAALGTKRGFVHSWGHQLKRSGKRKLVCVADESLKFVRNFIGGQKEVATDSINVNYGRDFRHEIEGDIAMAQEGMMAPHGGGRLEEKRGIEVGNIFQLGYHYSKLMRGAVFTDKDGKEKSFYMGCYGIGLGRTMAAIVEKHHDGRGIVWPEAVAPFRVQMSDIGGQKSDVIRDQAEILYNKLEEAGVETLWDDRDESAGVKFADCDLIGCPVRLVVSARNKGKIEWKRRGSGETELVSIGEAIEKLNLG